MTLIEVIIALVLFSVISLFTISQTSVGLRIKKKVADTNDYYHAARTVLRSLNTEISLAFHAYSDTKLGEYYKSQAVFTGKLPGEVLNVVPFSFFKGTKDKLSFSSTAHQRMYKNTSETDTCEISYYLEPDPDSEGLYDLIKRESYFIDEKLEEGGPIFVIASGIESISFKYFSAKGATGDGTWLEMWNSIEGETISTFPLAVEVTIVFVSPKTPENKLTITEKIKLLNPNNSDSQQGPPMPGGSSAI